MVQVRVVIGDRVELVLLPGTFTLSPHVFAELATGRCAFFVLDAYSIGEGEVALSPSDLNAVLAILQAIAVALALGRDPRRELRRASTGFSRLRPSHVLRLSGLMVPVDSMLGGPLVAGVVLGPLSALAFRVVVERQLFHHAAAAHVRRVK